MGCTLSRISTRLSASTEVSGGEPLGDCSARNVVETMNGMSWASTPSLARSSGGMEEKSGEGFSSSAGQTRDRGDEDSLWITADM